jgi:hypothetical protein
MDRPYFSDLPYLRAAHGQAVFYFLTTLISANTSEIHKCLSEMKELSTCDTQIWFRRTVR